MTSVFGGLLCKFLVRHGFFVSAARDAAHARSLLSGLDFDLVVLDVMMPGEDGITLTRSLREAARNMPILLLTARGETEDRINGLEAGADDYLPKPFEPKELLLRINAILRRVPTDPGGDELPKSSASGRDPVRYRAGRDVAGRRDGTPDSDGIAADANIFRGAGRGDQPNAADREPGARRAPRARARRTGPSMCRSPGCGARSRPIRNSRAICRRCAGAGYMLAPD